ncbi:hypothetical protein GCM10009681_39200 [Luedemannella helvata]|uniref:NADH dehydrogenase [ubiquinone] 1 alpha subcomplex subunit 11 n=1 Tax=Luedemannella helvata TaxID=349315 RepID=A0ABP4WW44_9ACTN
MRTRSVAWYAATGARWAGTLTDARAAATGGVGVLVGAALGPAGICWSSATPHIMPDARDNKTAASSGSVPRAAPLSGTRHVGAGS